jgi:hypothetical protein
MLPPALHSPPLLFFLKVLNKKSPLKIHYLHPTISAHAPHASLKRLIFEPTNTHCTNIVNKGKRNHENSHHKEKKKEQLKLPCLEK